MDDELKQDAFEEEEVKEPKYVKEGDLQTPWAIFTCWLFLVTFTLFVSDCSSDNKFEDVYDKLDREVEWLEADIEYLEEENMERGKEITNVAKEQSFKDLPVEWISNCHYWGVEGGTIYACYDDPSPYNKPCVMSFRYVENYLDVNGHTAKFAVIASRACPSK